MMKLKPSIVCTGLLLSLISCYSIHSDFQIDLGRSPGSEMQGGNLSGKVLDTQNRPIKGATVIVAEDGRIVSTTATDEFGNYRLEGLPSRDYALNASANGYKADAYMVRVIEGVENEYTFTLEE